MTRLTLSAFALCAALPLLATGQTTGADNRYVFLGNARSYDRTPSGVVVHADNGTVAIDAIAGVGARVRTRFGDSNAAFPAIHSLATGDTPPALGVATVRESGDSILVSGDGVVVRVARHPVRIAVTDAGGNALFSESFGGGTWQDRITHIVNDPGRVAYYGLGEQPMPLVRNGNVYPLWNTEDRKSTRLN